MSKLKIMLLVIMVAGLAMLTGCEGRLESDLQVNDDLSGRFTWSTAVEFPEFFRESIKDSLPVYFLVFPEGTDISQLYLDGVYQYDSTVAGYDIYYGPAYDFSE